MIVTAAAFHRQAQEHTRSGRGSIDDAFDAPFLGDDAALIIDAVIAIETGRHAIIDRRVRQQIAGQLLDRELIERHVAVVSVDHPVAPLPHVPLGVGLISVRIGIPRIIQPLHRHLLTVSRRCKQPIDHLLICIG